MYSVYALGDPRTGAICYIGQAQNVYRRFAQHINSPHPNKLKNTWMDEIKSAGMVPTLTILETDIDQAHILERETFWINHYQAQGANLLNDVIMREVRYVVINGQRLRKIRTSNFISRRELAELSGVAESTIVRMENPKHKSQQDVVEKVLKALGEKIGQELTVEGVEGLNIYNIMRDRKQRGQDAA